jgi:hypothetical protein
MTSRRGQRLGRFRPRPRQSRRRHAHHPQPPRRRPRPRCSRKWGTLPPQPVWADIHYAWELEDAEGEWQAGGSANSLEDVQREGNRYRQTYSQDGPHKLIIQRHCVTTIKRPPMTELITSPLFTNA